MVLAYLEVYFSNCTHDLIPFYSMLKRRMPYEIHHFVSSVRQSVKNRKRTYLEKITNVNAFPRKTRCRLLVFKRKRPF